MASADHESKGNDEEMEEPPIILLKKEQLCSKQIMNEIYKDMKHHYYAIKSFDPVIYMIQAWHGCIAVAMQDYLLPEIQRSYCTLDIYQNLHIPKGVIKRLKKSSKSYQYILKVNKSLDAVLSNITTSHKDNSWVSDKYQTMCRHLYEAGIIAIPGTNSTFQFFTIELYRKPLNDRKEEGGVIEELVAGEIGYTIGSIYTSLTGFTIPNSQSYGLLQLIVLALILRQDGYAFWNLGHPPNRAKQQMIYKADIGGTVIDRYTFLEQWFTHREINKSKVGDKKKCLVVGSVMGNVTELILEEVTRQKEIARQVAIEEEPLINK